MMGPGSADWLLVLEDLSPFEKTTFSTEYGGWRWKHVVERHCLVETSAPWCAPTTLFVAASSSVIYAAVGPKGAPCIIAVSMRYRQVGEFRKPLGSLRYVGWPLFCSLIKTVGLTYMVYTIQKQKTANAAVV